MRKIALPAITALSLALLMPQQSMALTTAAQASATTAEVPDQPLAEGTLSTIGPGLYSTADKTFQVDENDVDAALIGRRHTVAEQLDGSLAKPESAPATRPEMGVFGPNWEAEFVGGQLNRKLEQQGDKIVVTDLGVDEKITYALKSSIDYPDGGGVKKYATADGSEVTATSKWNDATGTLVTTMVEVLGVDLSTVAAGDDTFTDAAGNPIPAADLKPTYKWQQAATGTDRWRVTSVGNNTYATTVQYDAKGRVFKVSTPAAGEKLATSTSVTYADTTTAAGTSFGDYTGRVKQISVTEGATTQTLARYAYDSSGLLRTVTNPSEAAEPAATYAYDGVNRLIDINSPSSGSWDLSFAGNSAAPTATVDGEAVPTPGVPVEGDAPDDTTGVTDPPPAADFPGGEITDPTSYPSKCSWARHWLYYWKTGCTSKVAHYGWHSPKWKKTPTGYWVRGINHDHCTTAPDKPLGYNFIPACDMHDYGYGLIGNTYKGYKYYLSRNKGLAVDAVFYSTLYWKTCSAYFWKSTCRSLANTYYAAVTVFGRAKNGANAT
ncbi:phospholipase A2 [Streptomyces vietnamensis]|uniref:phospholipase A2 n=1 Tax=Streptomyces vietnamensis TaxID=362257 RepID=UPI001FE23D34|nr:phospholipase A2 [Streptomyces vietnamensis]